MNRENELGNKIKELRKSIGLTQEELAEKVGIDNKHLSKIENGKHAPSFKTIKKISDVLKADIANIELLSETFTDKESAYFQSLKILNSAKNDKEKEYYLEVLKLAQKGLKLRNF